MPDFGPLAAQNDDQLLKYFHKTQQAEAMIDFKKPLSSFIFVARPGSGKTALLRWLENEQGNFSALVIRSEETRLFSDDVISNLGDLRVMVEAELTAALISEILVRKLGSSKSQADAQDFLSKRWTKVVGRFFTRKFAGLSILGCGFTLKPEERREYLSEIRNTAKTKEARTLLKNLAKEGNILIAVDDPELIVGRGLIDVTPENAVRLGALLSIVCNLHSMGIRVVVFLKEHILQNLSANYLDFRHFGDRIEGLEWSGNDLLEMLRQRVSKRLGTRWEDVFALSTDALRDQVFPFLINGPRDLLSLCNLAGKEDGKITKGRFDKVIRALRSEKWSELASNYGKQWEKVDQFAQALMSALSTNFAGNLIPPGGIKKFFEAEHANPQSEIFTFRKIAWIDNAKWENPPIEERLFLVGCLGYVYEKAKVYPWRGRSLDSFRLADSHFLSPLFVEGGLRD